MEPSDITSDYSFIINQLDAKIASSCKDQTESPIKSNKHSSTSSTTSSPQDQKRIKFSDNLLNSSTFLNDTNDISINSTSIKYQSQIDRYKIEVEKYKEELKNVQDELSSYKDQTTRQLLYLEETNLKLKKESEQRLEKYYEEKKNWQVKIRELEYQIQNLKKNSTSTSSTTSSTLLSSSSTINNSLLSSSTIKNNDEILLKLKEYQLEIENEKKENILLKQTNSDLTKLNNELNHKILLLESSVRTYQDDNEDYQTLRKNSIELNSTLLKYKKEFEKLNNKLKNQELLEEEILSLNNKLKYYNDLLKDYNNIQVEYNLLNEEKKKWNNILHNILNDSNEINNDTSSPTPSSSSSSSSIKDVDFSPTTVMNLMNNLKEKYLQVKSKETSLTLKNNLLDDEIKKLNETILQKENTINNLNNLLLKIDIKSDLVNKENLLLINEKSNLENLLNIYQNNIDLSTSNEASSASNVILKTFEESLKKNSELRNEITSFKDEILKKINITNNSSSSTSTTAPTSSIPSTDSSSSSSLKELEEKYNNLRDCYLDLQELTGVDLLPSNTKVLRYTLNPTDKLYNSSNPPNNASSYPGDVIDNLKKTIIELKKKKDLELNSNYSSSNSTSTSSDIDKKKNADIIDPQKRIQRLKDVFLEKISKFRQAVCLLTGYKMDMLPTDPNDPNSKTRIKLRSIYAASPNDDLLFQINGDLPELLETEFTKNIDPMTMMYLTNYNSVPGFLSTVTLQLFENQTF